MKEGMKNESNPGEEENCGLRYYLARWSSGRRDSFFNAR
jgi:hypothetical protein